MKRWLPFAVIALAAVAVIIFVERRQSDTEVGPRALLHLIADSERQANRIPARVWRLNDEEEIRIGDELAERYLTGSASAASDPEQQRVQAYVARVGTAIARHAGRKLPYASIILLTQT